MTEAVDLGSYRNERIRRYEGHIKALATDFFGTFSDFNVTMEPNNDLARIAFRLHDKDNKTVNLGIQKDFVDYVTRNCPPELEEFSPNEESLLQVPPVIVLEKKRQAD